MPHFYFVWDTPGGQIDKGTLDQPGASEHAILDCTPCGMNGIFQHLKGLHEVICYESENKPQTCLLPSPPLHLCKLSFAIIVNSQMHIQEDCDGLQGGEIVDRRGTQENPATGGLEVHGEGMCLSIQMSVLINDEVVEVKHLKWQGMHLIPMLLA